MVFSGWFSSEISLYLLFPCVGSDGDQSISNIIRGTWLTSEGHAGLVLMLPRCLSAVFTTGQLTLSLTSKQNSFALKHQSS